MNPRTIKVAAALVLSGLVALTTSSAAIASSLSFKITGEYARRMVAACGKAHDFHIVHRSASVELKGYAVPPPSSHSSALIHLLRCSRGTWHGAGTLTVEVKGSTSSHPGKYKAFVPGRRFNGRYAAYVTYGGLRSRNEYVTSTR